MLVRDQLTVKVRSPGEGEYTGKDAKGVDILKSIWSGMVRGHWKNDCVAQVQTRQNGNKWTFILVLCRRNDPIVRDRGRVDRRSAWSDQADRSSILLVCAQSR